MLSEVLNQIGLATELSTAHEIERLPKTDKFIEIAGIQVPLYGELLVGESALFTKINQACAPTIAGIVKLYKSLRNTDQPLSALIPQLQVGRVSLPVVEEVNVDWDSLGYKELKELAARAGVTEFRNFEVIIDGEVDTTLMEIAIKHVSAWFNNGITAPEVVGVVNKVLHKEKPLRVVSSEIIEVDTNTLLKECGLTWGDLYTFGSIDSEYFQALVIFGFRTGITSFNPFSFLSETVATQIKQALLAELPKVAKDEPIEENPNVRTQAEDVAVAAKGKKVKPKEGTTTSETPKPEA
jgi:hypothetical protein